MSWTQIVTEVALQFKLKKNTGRAIPKRFFHENAFIKTFWGIRKHFFVMILQMHSGKIIIINISSFKVPWFMFSFPDTQDARLELFCNIMLSGLRITFLRFTVMQSCLTPHTTFTVIIG